MKRLYIRIYLAVLGSIILSILLAALVGRIVSDGETFFDRKEFFVEAAHAMLPPASAPLAEQKKALEKWRALSGINLVLVDKQGAIIAGAGKVAVGPSDGGKFRRWRDSFDRRSVELKDGRVLIGEREDHLKRPFAGPGMFLVLLILVGLAVAVAAYPVVRRITRNLEKLETGVAAFGAGDLSARVSVQGRDEVARLATTFNQSAERVEQLVTSNKTLLANASHELRSPLARLRMGVEAISDSAPAALREELNQNVRELDQLVEEILVASRIEAGGDAGGTGNDTFEKIDLAGLAAEECARTDAELEIKPGANSEVFGNARLLRRMIRNLLENAKRYGEGSPVSATIGAGEVNRIVLEVCDRGPGIPEAEREKIFEPFFRRAGGSEAHGGVGLGLALVRQIATHHGGNVICTGREGGGACFRAELPAHPA